MLALLHRHSELHRLQFPFTHAAYLLVGATVGAATHTLLQPLLLLVVPDVLLLLIVNDTVGLRIELLPFFSEYLFTYSTMLGKSFVIK